MAITAFLSSSPGLLNRGSGGPASLGRGPHSSIFLQLQLLNRGSGGPASLGRGPHSSIFLQLQLFNRGPEGPLCWVLVFSIAPYLQLTDFLSSPGLYNCSTPTFFLWASQIALIQPVHGQGYILIFLDRMHLLFTQVHFPILTAWPGSIC